MGTMATLHVSPSLVLALRFDSHFYHTVYDSVMTENTHDWRTGRHVWPVNCMPTSSLVTKYRRKVMSPRVTRTAGRHVPEVCERFECELEEFRDRQGPCASPRGLSTESPAQQTRREPTKTNGSKRVRATPQPPLQGPRAIISLSDARLAYPIKGQNVTYQAFEDGSGSNDSAGAPVDGSPGGICSRNH